MPEPAPSRQRRLPGKPAFFRRIIGLSSVLWLNDDGLLERESTYVTERHRRYAYGDIQALLLRETPRGLIVNVVLGVLATGGGLLLWSMDDSSIGKFFGGFGAFWLVLLVVNVLRGKTCRCQLQTAAGPHVLRSLSRVRPARRAWRLILEKVDAAQGAPPPPVAEDAAREMR